MDTATSRVAPTGLNSSRLRRYAARAIARFKVSRSGTLSRSMPSSASNGAISRYSSLAMPGALRTSEKPRAGSGLGRRKSVLPHPASAGTSSCVNGFPLPSNG
jgi:hypothetical protein